MEKEEKQKPKLQILAALQALRKIAHDRVAIKSTEVTSYDDLKTRQATKKKGKREKKSKKKGKPQSPKKKTEDSEQTVEKVEEESEDNEEQECLTAVAEALGWPGIAFQESVPELDGCLVGKVILYGQSEGVQLLEVADFFPEGTGSKQGEAFNYELKELFGTDKGKLSNYVLKTGD